MIRTYLDQNILSAVQEGLFCPATLENFIWVYSDEHFKEISRGGDTSFLSVLRHLKARRIEVIFDQQGCKEDQVTLHEYVCPLESYQAHLETISEVRFDQTLFTDLIAGFAGGNNYEDVQTLPERFQAQLENLLESVGPELRPTAPDLRANITEIVSHLRDTRSLESLREPLRFHNGRLGNLESAKVLPEICRRIKEQFGDPAADQLSKYEATEQRGGEKSSRYFGIIVCHTMLNFMGYRTDKDITCSATIPNIMSDVAHIANASYCDVLISADRRLCDKASAIYKYMGIQTLVGRLVHSPST